ncbi:MAG: hypothetical protein KAR47_18350, partial [Planctomycetes bacterium]|nr:hypothetical protein [Planctomycetota bacterium]
KYEYFLFGPYVYYVSISAEVEDYCDAISGGGGGGGDGGGGICSSSLCFGPGMSVTPGSTPGASIGSIVGFGSGTPGR